MSETEAIGWVVKALVVLIGLYITICKPMLANQKAMTELTVTMKDLSKKLTALEANNTQSHRRLWEKNSEQDKLLGNHESRISVLEKQEVKNER